MKEVAEQGADISLTVRGNFRRKAMVFFIYLMFGPPIGGLATILTFLILSAVLAGDLGLLGDASGEGVIQLFFLPVWVVMLSLWGYLFGGVQAAMTGLILAACSDLDGRFGYDRAVIATLPPSMFAGILIGKDYVNDHDAGHGFLILVLTLASIVASLVLRYLFRERFRIPCARSS
jgi:hypothetical protein